jgi:PAS domain-containing protein
MRTRNYNLFGRIRSEMSPPAVGVWYIELERRTRTDGAIRWRSIGKPKIDPDYCSLFGLNDESKFPAQRLSLVHKDNVREVREAMLRAKNGPESDIQECTFRIVTNITESGIKSKRIRWLYARIGKMRQDNRWFLACWNSDVTFLKEREQFYEKVLSTFPGFVFLKEHISSSDGGGHEFQFKYCNKKLADALLASSGEHKGSSVPFYVGRTDGDFFPQHQAEAFFKTDKAAFEAKGDPVVIAEEPFHPRAPSDNGKTGGNEKTLTTVKVRFDTTDIHGRESQCVLGVAVDLSGVTQLLKSAMELCADALFIKNEDGRYVYVNDHFRRFLGLSAGSRIEGRTLREIFSENVNILPNRWQAFVHSIESDDSNLLHDSTGRPTCENTIFAFFSDERKWRVWKTRIGDINGTKHILGVVRPELDQRDIDNQIIRNSPHYICIKDSSLKVIYCNWKFAQRRGLTVRQCFDKSDEDFWPEDKFPGQAKRFQQRDREVLNLLPALEEIDASSELDDRSKRERRGELLAQYTDYTETLTIEVPTKSGLKQVTRKLLTTKWPDRINGHAVIYVAYSDITEISQQAERWHRYTFHAIGNEITQFEMALVIAKRLVAEQANDVDSFRSGAVDIYRCLLAGRAGLKFYVDHHLKFMRGSCDLSQPVKITQLIEERLNELVKCPFDYAVWEPCDIAPEATLAFPCGDEVFLRAAISEMLRNALKATQRRYGVGYSDSIGISDSKPPTSGRIKVTCRVHNRADRVKRRCVVISVRDQGDGVVPDSEGNRLLQAAIARMRNEADTLQPSVRSVNFPDTSGGFGLRFLFSVARDHNGSFNIRVYDGHVEAHLVIPISQSKQLQ